MKQHSSLVLLTKAVRHLSFLVITCIIIPSFGQSISGWELEKMPVDLERDFALSSLPPHLRSGATVYLLDPAKGYYASNKGSNGFICFVVRTEWEWVEFRKDLGTPISVDAEGAQTIFPVYADVAAMRASGKFSAQQIKDTVNNRFSKRVYKSPARVGISYMLAPIMRTYEGSSYNVATMSIPHYMFYAPFITNADIGGDPKKGGPVILGEPGPHSYIILGAGEKEKTKILEDNSELLRGLEAYKSYFKVTHQASHH
jgi:hypothetical protein